MSAVLAEGESRVAVVTGGVSGIGAATCRRLAAAGFVTAATYASDDQAAACLCEGGLIHAYKWDVADYDACQEEVKRITRELGPISILVNNAGIVRDGALHKMTSRQWHEVINTNLTGCFNMCRAVVGGMRDRGFGRIVNIGSVNGQSGQFGQANYCAAKAGLVGLTKALALEVARKGVTVNVVAPGYTDTTMLKSVPLSILEDIVQSTPIGRLANPDEIAHVIEVLVSDAASFITGATIPVNGGRYMA